MFHSECESPKQTSGQTSGRARIRSRSGFGGGRKRFRTRNLSGISQTNTARHLSLEYLESRRLLHGVAPTLSITDGLVLRLSADHVTTEAGQITSWPDLSGHGNDLAVLSGSPTIAHGVRNGHDVIRLDGVDDVLGRTGFNDLPVGNRDRTVVMMVDYHDGGWGGFVYGSDRGNASFGPMVSPFGNLGVFGNFNTNNFETDLIGTTSSWVEQAAVVQGGNVLQFANGNLIGTNAHDYATGDGGIRVGVRLNDVNPIKMDVAEILIYDRAFSDVERRELDVYFQENYYAEPEGFVTDLVVSSLNQPIALEFLTETQLLVAERTGTIQYVDRSFSPPAVHTYLDIPNVNTVGERGMSDLVLDPDFESNGYIYTYYSHDPTSTNRISRFEHQGTTADLSSEVILWETPEIWRGTDHQGGSLNFGADGKLYLTTGDQQRASTAGNLADSAGKILRFNPDGSIPDDNPFVDGPGGNLDEIYAYGLRNPFRGRIDPATDRFYIGEVGGNDQAIATEDIHLGVRGANPWLAAMSRNLWH